MGTSSSPPPSSPSPHEGELWGGRSYVLSERMVLSERRAGELWGGRSYVLHGEEGGGVMMFLLQGGSRRDLLLQEKGGV